MTQENLGPLSERDPRHFNDIIDNFKIEVNKQEPGHQGVPGVWRKNIIDLTKIDSRS